MTTNANDRPAPHAVESDTTEGRLPYVKPELKALKVSSTQGKGFPSFIESTTFLGS